MKIIKRNSNFKVIFIGIIGLIVTANIYCGSASFKDLLDVKMAISERDENAYGKIYEPSTVTQTLKLTKEAKMTAPIVLNAETGELVWADSFLDKNDVNLSIASLNQEDYVRLGKEALEINQYGPGFDMLIKALNCNIVTDMKDADYVFTQEEVDESMLKEGAHNITQKDYDMLVKLMDENRTEHLFEPEKDQDKSYKVYAFVKNNNALYIETEDNILNEQGKLEWMAYDVTDDIDEKVIEKVISLNKAGFIDLKPGNITFSDRLNNAINEIEINKDEDVR